jgi:hypothetical protein
MTSVTTRTGGCQCGSIRYELVGTPQMLYVCHCTDCQRQSSSAFGMSLRMNPDEIDFSQSQKQLQSWDTRGEDGLIKRCSFCPDCGTRIMHGSDNPDETVSIKAGSLDDTSQLRPVAHIWLRSAQPWVQIDRNQYRCFDEEPDNEDELRRLWQTYSREIR